MRNILTLLLLLSVCAFAGCSPSTPGATASASPSVVPGTTVPSRPSATPSPGPDFTTLHMFDALIGWAQVEDQVWRTTDGGLHWRNVTPAIGAASAAPPYVSSTDFLTASVAWITLMSAGASTSKIEETTDGGQTWQVNALQVTGGGFSFINPQDGWVCANGGVAAGSSAFDLFRTTDGGATWTKAQDAQQIVNGAPGALPFGGDKNCPSFISATTGWVTGYEPVNNFRYFYVTYDGGFHWQAQSLPPAQGVTSPDCEYSPMAPIFFSNDPRDGVLPVSLSTPPATQSLAIYSTRDGGASWQSSQLLSGNSYSFLDAQHWWVGQGSNLLVTSDGGQSWTTLTPGGPFQNVSALDFISAQDGWAVGGDGSSATTLLRTTDGGQTWTALNYSEV